MLQGRPFFILARQKLYTPYFQCSDVLFAEYQTRELGFHAPLADTDDGLRAFELKDHDGICSVFRQTAFKWAWTKLD